MVLTNKLNFKDIKCTRIFWMFIFYETTFIFIIFFKKCFFLKEILSSEVAWHSIEDNVTLTCHRGFVKYKDQNQEIKKSRFLLKDPSNNISFDCLNGRQFMRMIICISKYLLMSNSWWRQKLLQYTSIESLSLV